jgi:hypothetical protein
LCGAKVGWLLQPAGRGEDGVVEMAYANAMILLNLFNLFFKLFIRASLVTPKPRIREDDTRASV